MKWLIVLFLVTASCGMDKAACGSLWFNASGLNICDNNLYVESEDIDYLVNVLEEEVHILYPEVTELAKTFELNGVEVIFTDEGIAIECQEVDSNIYYCDDLAYGVNINGLRIYSNYHKCLAFTSLTHELLHSIESLYLNKDLGDHTTPGFFDEVVINVNKKVKQNTDNCKSWQ